MKKFDEIVHALLYLAPTVLMITAMVYPEGVGTVVGEYQYKFMKGYVHAQEELTKTEAHK